MLTIGSLFSGIGGLELGLEWAGHGPVQWQVEIDPYCRQVLARHWPEAERHEDVRTVGAANLKPVDIICGGFPCQDISAAGSGAGLDGARSGLWYEFERIVKEMHPEWVVVENVNSGAKRWIDAVRGALEQLGYETLPIPIAASDVGAPHLRRRVFIVAHAKCQPLRHERERGPARRERGVRAQGDTEPGHDGGTRDAADANGGRCQGEREPTSRGLSCPPRRESNGCGRAWPDCARRAARPADGPAWTAQPPVCGVDDGPSSKLDRSRLRALGNSVVPQCVQVVGEVINLLLERQHG
jgi:DNA (cytosine-5)-methyltransferase 1